MADLKTHEIHFEIKQNQRLKDVYSGYTYFAEEDVLLARVTPCFENGKSGIASNLKNGIAFGSSEFFVYRADKQKILPEIIYYFISSKAFIDNGKNYMSGTGGITEINKKLCYKIQNSLANLKRAEENCKRD